MVEEFITQDFTEKVKTLEEAEVVKLMCLIPPIAKMDSFLNTLVTVKKLSSPRTALTR